MDEIRKKLKQAIERVFGVKVEPEVTEAPEGFHADYASNVCFLLAKELHKAPREIASAVAEEMNNERINSDGVKSGGIMTEVAGGGFLNFISPDEYFVGKIEEIAGDFDKYRGENISQDEYDGKTVVCEFSDPNPFKVLHVGHLYTSIVGDAIARLVENAGGKVVRANFGGDVGMHVAKTIYVLASPRSAKDLFGDRGPTLPSSRGSGHFILGRDLRTSPRKTFTSAEPENPPLTIEDIARAYVEGTRAYEEDEKAHEEITKLNKEIYRINKENVREGKVAEIYWKGRELSYQYFQDFYDSIGVKFDKYYPESTVAEKGLRTVKEHTPEVYEESEGAIVFRGEKYGLHTRVFVNKEGLPTYEAKDVGLLMTKAEDWDFDTSIVITGNDIIDYMKVVLKSVEQYAPELVKRTKHITHGNVRLPGNEKMSSRRGNFIKAVDIINEVREKCSDEKIVLAAIKYGFLKYKIGNNIEFNIEECVSTTGNSGVYLLYSAVRAKKIIQKCGEEMEKNYSMNEWEKKLSKKIVQFPEIVKQSTRELSPNILCNFLFEMSQEFSRFYENVKVAGSEYEKMRKKIVQAYLNIMECGLGLLGIKVPEEM